MREDILLMVSELVTNAVLHAVPGGRPQEIGLDIHMLGDSVVVAVTDRGGGFDPARLPGPRAGVAGARGLALVAALTDRRGIDSRDPFRVWFQRRR